MLALSFIDADKHVYRGSWRNMPDGVAGAHALLSHQPPTKTEQVMQGGTSHRTTGGAVEHKLLWRVGGEAGFTCFPAIVWQPYHGGIVVDSEPWRHKDTQRLLEQKRLFPSIKAFLKASPDLSCRVNPQHYQPLVTRVPATSVVPGVFGGVAAAGQPFVAPDAYRWRAPTLSLDMVRTVKKDKREMHLGEQRPKYVTDVQLSDNDKVFHQQREVRQMVEARERAVAQKEWTRQCELALAFSREKVEAAERLAHVLLGDFGSGPPNTQGLRSESNGSDGAGEPRAAPQVPLAKESSDSQRHQGLHQVVLTAEEGDAMREALHDVRMALDQAKKRMLLSGKTRIFIHPIQDLVRRHKFLMSVLETALQQSPAPGGEAD